MKIHKIIKRAIEHKNFCEDFLFEEKLNNKYMLFGVFDGCSSGIDSHFASSFIAKIVKNEAKKFLDSENISLKKIVFNSAKKLQKLQKDLSLSVNEILSTIILNLVNLEENSCELIAIGDGFISVDEFQKSINQENTPKYLAYFLNDIKNEDNFDDFLEKQAFYANFNKFDKFIISTDGIDSFKKQDYSNTEIIDVQKFMFEDEKFINNKAMLGRKLNILKNKYSLINADDLAMFRVQF